MYGCFSLIFSSQFHIMKKYFKYLLAIAFSIACTAPLLAGEGDTTKIRVHDGVHMSWWGEYNQWGVFPAAGSEFRRINLDFTFSCPTGGCSDWDYTVQVEALHRTGLYDSIAVPAPYYIVGNMAPDTIYSNINAVYVTYFDSTGMSMDSVLATQFIVLIQNDPGDPFLTTDSLLLYPGNYYNYVYDNSGVVIDSVFVGSDNSLINSFITTYSVFEIIERIELARVITPYGGSYPLTWSNTVHFDITDLAPILHDSVEIRAFYGGWSDGFGLTLDFNFIEGTPPRTPIQVRNIYSSGPGGFPYGNTGNPIENYLTPETFSIGANETNSMLRIIPTGHGAGSQNCAEFCLKSYRIKLDGVQSFTQQIWRNDCGLNHLMGQAGTWLYDRANWCPGEKGIVREHELTSLVAPGNNVTIDMDLDPYTNNVSGQNPNYILAAQLITYSNPNFSDDASVEEILSPNADFYYNRYNPICNNPLIAIKNTGSNPLTSVTITYGINGATPSVYNWTGNLTFNQAAQVQLSSFDWNSLTSTPDQFYAYVSQPNGGADQYAYNDTMRTWITFPKELPSTFVLLFKTNTAFNETTYNIKDDQGNVVFANGFLSANTIYRDTITLAPGCYTYTVNDSDKDGLSFFANGDGTGYTRFINAFGPGVLQFFNADFGTRIVYQFTVGYVLNTPEISSESRMTVFPNPSTGAVNIDIAYPSRETGIVEIIDALGKIVFTETFADTDNPVLHSDFSNLPAGVYHVSATSAAGKISQRLILQPAD